MSLTGEAGNSASPPLGVNRPCLLTANGDASTVQVYRSPLVKAGSRMLAPVADFIEAQSLELVYTETDDDREDWMFGQRIREIYA